MLRAPRESIPGLGISLVIALRRFISEALGSGQESSGGQTQAGDCEKRRQTQHFILHRKVPLCTPALWGPGAGSWSRVTEVYRFC